MFLFVTRSDTKKRRDDSRRLFKLFWSGLLFVAIATTAAFATFAALTATAPTLGTFSTATTAFPTALGTFSTATPTLTAFSTLATTAAGALGHSLAQCVALGLVEFAVLVLIEFLHQAFTGRTAAISVAVASTASALGETLPQCLLAFTGLCLGNLAGLEIFLNLLCGNLVALTQTFADATGGAVCGAATTAAYCLAGGCALGITQSAIAILVESLDNGLTGGSISTSIRLFAGSLLGRSLVGCRLLSLSGVHADAEQKCNSKGFYCFNFHDVYFFLFSLPTSSMTEKLNAARE